MDQIEEVKHKTDIVELVSEHVSLKKAGRNFKGLCPFHSEKTPSFNVSPELQIYKCFGCSLGGDCFNFLMEFEKIDFGQALKILADRAGVKLKPLGNFPGFQEKEEIYAVNFVTSEFYHYLLTEHQIGENARVYLKNRGINDESIKAFKLGFSPEASSAAFNFLTKKREYKPELLERAGIVGVKDGRYYDRFRGRIIFPLFDHFGNVLGFAGRVIEDKGDLAKYINTPETLVYKKGQTLFGLNVAKQDIKREGFVVVTEGEFDCISSWQAGVKNVVAIKGSAFTGDQASLINRFCQRIVLALDADFAGDKAARRGLEVLQHTGIEVRVANLADYKDPDEFAWANKEGYLQAIMDAQGVYDFLIDSSFGRFDAHTTEGKAKISREITPILAGIEDEIVRAHCIKKVAEGLGVSEQAVFNQAAKTRYTSQRTDIIQSSIRQRERRDILEEHLLSIILNFKPEALLELEKDLISNPARLRLVEIFKRNYTGNFNSQEFAQGLPAELRDVYSEIVLSDISFDSNEVFDKELVNIKREIEVLNLHEKIEELTSRIKDLEKKGETSQVAILAADLASISRRLASLEPN